MKAIFALIAITILLLAGCAGKAPNNNQPPAPLGAPGQPQAQLANNNQSPVPPGVPGQTQPELANPASKYCVDQGFSLEIRTNVDGSQTGYCKFPSGECEEWAYFRGECTDVASFSMLAGSHNPTSREFIAKRDGTVMIKTHHSDYNSTSVVSQLKSPSLFAQFVAMARDSGFEAMAEGYDNCSGKGYAGCPANDTYIYLSMQGQGGYEKAFTVYASAARPHALDDIIAGFRGFFDEARLKAPLAPKKCDVMGKECCEAAGAHWNECASACPNAGLDKSCTAQCIPQCECYVGDSCPENYICSDFYSPSMAASAVVGVCKLPAS